MWERWRSAFINAEPPLVSALALSQMPERWRCQAAILLCSSGDSYQGCLYLLLYVRITKFR